MANLREFCREYQELHEKHPRPDAPAKIDYYSGHSEHIRGQKGNPTLSIVIPMLNEAALAPRCFASINAACAILPVGEIAEVIVVDNGSKDATREIAQEFGVKVVKEGKKGIAKAREKGLRSVSDTSEVMVTADADTVVPDFWLWRYVQEFGKNLGLVMAFGGANPIIDAKVTARQRLCYHIYRIAETPYRILRSMEGYAVPASNNMAVSKEAACEVGGYNTSLARGEDYDLYLKMRNVGEVKRIKGLDVVVSGRRIFKDDNLGRKIVNGVRQLCQFVWKHEGMTGYSYRDFRTDS